MLNVDRLVNRPDREARWLREIGLLGETTKLTLQHKSLFCRFLGQIVHVEGDYLSVRQTSFGAESEDRGCRYPRVETKDRQP